ncbi:MAG TPA: cupin domain-containing protein [Synergistaceae bacterium]|nr:cupin domain-containing protein [Synergistales bacterium]HPR89854.1 cupin domain-containing protein [Synergistaceae bacterium]HRV97364.1 cupin domain-containing protein [Aminobacteriaceae bacterium]
MADFVLLAGKISDIRLAEDPSHASGIEKRIVFAPGKFWNDYVARHFTVKGKNSKTPFHTHDWPHYVFILSGRCNATIDGTVYPLEKGCWAHVPPNVEHFFESTGEEPLDFICIVPPKGDPAGSAHLA